ncbi:hypothetical protein D3OALGA1CA_928 [Olavius algarvensis associated proteobacterium Delta 3]|nr:hypothetical protein D3OALGA1CA_928 [Olavius algarvensis associated proteobacterium Delta 3]CAB5129379.1 hypothetical protein D3OALGB2SA_3514 [Olavius algarvensis associated proteobacterium Delta 3]
MENIKHCGVVVRRPEDVWEGTRTALGLAAHNYWAYLFVFDVAVEMTDALEENLEWLEEMECPVYSNVSENAQWGFQHIATDQLARELKKMDIVIPFGNRP